MTATMTPTDVRSPAAGLPFSTLPVTLAPHRNLLTYSLLAALVLGPAFIIGMIAGYIRYRTLRYDIDEEGIAMRWGILFRREVSLTYARIQDIHLSSNVVERWLGLAKIELQTASGSATAEMTVQGVREVEALRDFFYSRMRGTRGAAAVAVRADGGGTVADADELTAALTAVAAELRALRLDREKLAAPTEPVR